MKVCKKKEIKKRIKIKDIISRNKDTNEGNSAWLFQVFNSSSNYSRKCFFFLRLIKSTLILQLTRLSVLELLH